MAVEWPLSLSLTVLCHNHFLLHSTPTDEAFMIFELDGKNPAGVLS
jgi:hypothetical protein